MPRHLKMLGVEQRIALEPVATKTNMLPVWPRVEWSQNWYLGFKLIGKPAPIKYIKGATIGTHGCLSRAIRSHDQVRHRSQWALEQMTQMLAFWPLSHWQGRGQYGWKPWEEEYNCTTNVEEGEPLVFSLHSLISLVVDRTMARETKF